MRDKTFFGKKVGMREKRTSGLTEVTARAHRQKHIAKKGENQGG
jgi:hypothetical protein